MLSAWCPELEFKNCLCNSLLFHLLVRSVCETQAMLTRVGVGLWLVCLSLKCKAPFSITKTL